jgi:hypothetical protein
MKQIHDPASPDYPPEPYIPRCPVELRGDAQLHQYA